MPRLLEFIQNNPVLILALLAILGGLAWTLIAGRSQGGQRLGPSEVTRLINSEDAAVIDVRPDGEFRNGHIINAINVPENQIEAQVAKLEKYRERPVVTVCRTGQVSAKAAAKLRKLGFEKVYTLAGGLLSWEGASLPLAKK